MAKVRFQMLQVREEILWAYRRIEHYLDTINVILELGSYCGGTLVFMSPLVSSNGLLVSVDPCLHGAEVKPDRITDVTGIKTSLLRMRSEDAVDAVKSILGGRAVDLLISDSIHTAKQTKKELELYTPLLNVRAVAMVHDIATGYSRVENAPGYTGEPQEPTGEYWQRIKFGFSYEEKRIKKNYPNFGIGLLFYDNDDQRGIPREYRR